MNEWEGEVDVRDFHYLEQIFPLNILLHLKKFFFWEKPIVAGHIYLISAIICTYLCHFYTPFVMI